MKVSIIIPIYNVGQYLRACLDSCLAQTYTDLEIICVDDGSTDGSGRIADEYAALDSRFKVVHKPNGGLPSARKAGIEVASGEYLFHLDGDDSLPLTAIENLYSIAENTDADICVGNAVIINEESNTIEEFSFHPAEELTGVEYMEAILINRIFNIWGKLIRRNIYLNNIDIPNYISCGEDLIHLYQLACYAKKVRFSSNISYYYYMHNTSMSNETGIWGKAYDKTILASVFLLRLKGVNKQLHNQQVLKDYMATEIYYYFLSPHPVSKRKSELKEIMRFVDLDTIKYIRNETKRFVLLVSKISLEIGKMIVNAIKTIREK